ncbi:MAG: hypothetical protein ACOY82_05995 [Pseudomonadota bacterium]
MQLKAIVLVLIPLLVNSFLIAEVIASGHKSPISVRKIEGDTYLLSGRLRTGTAFEGIRFQKHSFDGSWVLHIQSSEGMKVWSAQGRWLEPAILTSEEFIELTEGALGALQKERMMPRYIDVDMQLVEGYSTLVEPAIRRAKCGDGIVKTADKCWSDALRKAMAYAEVTKRVCSVAMKYGGECPRWPIGFDAIMLLSRMHNQPRTHVAASRNAGVDVEAMSFSISIKRNASVP